nr:cobalamin-dependent protein [Spirochaetota bacterium]
MKKKVLLVNPPYPLEESPSPPFGLMSLGAFLLKQDIDVIIADYIVNPYSREHARETVQRFKPDVIGATGVTMNINTALGILRDYSEESPGSAIVMGGPHATFDAENLLADNPHLDFIVRGEGELTTTELLRNLNSPEAYASIRGLSY